ncbi:hypothetical protein QEN19_003299 [Hanseniaspora menglaensis]
MAVFSYRLNRNKNVSGQQQVYARKRHDFDMSRLFGDPFGITTITLSVLAWIVAIVGGICYIYLGDPKDSSDSGFPKFTWWGLGYQIFLIFIYILLYCYDLLDQYRSFITATTAVSFVYNTNSTTNMIYSSGNIKAATSAGCIVLSIINFFWLIYFGSDNSSPLNRYIDSFSLDGQRPSNIVSEYLQDRRLANIKRHQKQLEQQERIQSLQRGLNDQAQSTGFNQLGPDSSENRQYIVNLNETSEPPKSEAYSNQFHNPINAAAPSTSKMTENQQATQYQQHTTQPSQSITNSRSSMMTYSDTQEETNYPYKAVAIYEYIADESDPYEISFEEGEIMRVSDIEGRWWSCLKNNGERGIVPSNYVKLIDE